VSVERAIPTLRIDAVASRTLVAALALAHAAALGSVFVAVPHWSVRLLAALVLGTSAWRALRDQALRRAPGAVTRLELRGERDCSLVCRDGRRIEGRVRDSSFVATWLVVLHLDTPGRRKPRYVVLAPDSVAPTGLRRLRVRLRWTRPGIPEATDEDPSL
jgi:hypothetical protein